MKLRCSQSGPVIETLQFIQLCDVLLVIKLCRSQSRRLSFFFGAELNAISHFKILPFFDCSILFFNYVNVLKKKTYFANPC